MRPYQIKGRWYRPEEQPDYDEVGLARDFFNADVRWMNHYGFRPLDMPTLFGGLSV